MIRTIKRSSLPDGVRVTVELDAEVAFRSERLEKPRRVFFDLKGTRPVPALQDATVKFGDDLVREARLGRHPQNTTRIVFDMDGIDSYSMFTLYSPFRLVIDFKAAVPPVAITELEPIAPGRSGADASGARRVAPGAAARAGRGREAVA